jgi:hypothetical protein
MDTKSLLIQEIDQTLEPILDKIFDFLRFLKAQQEQEEVEIQADIDDAHAALEEAQQYGTISLADLKQELGLLNR